VSRSAPGAPLVVALVVAIVAAACGPAASPSPSPNDGPPSSPIDGVVLSVDASGLSQVHGFTLRTAAGAVLRFTLGTLENPTQFPPGHLAEHQANASPVRVSFVAGPEGGLIVYRLEDAPQPSPSA
jgi:hypothetical protein